MKVRLQCSSKKGLALNPFGAGLGAFASPLWACLRRVRDFCGLLTAATLLAWLVVRFSR